MTVAGTWNITTKTPMGDQQGQLVVVPGPGGSFSGSASAGALGSMDITGGTVDGNTLSWSMKVTTPMPMTLDCTANVSGDAITGQVKAGVFGSFALSGTRAG